MEDQHSIPTENNSEEKKNSESILSEENAVKWFPFIGFLAFIGLLYIGNRHSAERTIRTIDQLNKELKELRAEYMSNKAELMYRSNQTEVAKSLESTGIKEAKVPPKKIVITNEH